MSSLIVTWSRVTTEPAAQSSLAPVGNDRIAYQVFGQGKRDLVHVTGLWSDVDVSWEEPTVARFLRRLGSFSRLIRFDPRGSGLSDPRLDAHGT